MANNIYSINQLGSNECLALISELKELDTHIEIKVEKVVNATGASLVEALEYVVLESPILWAKVYLNWTCRDYQHPILMEGKKSRQLVLRLGRRLGKTDSMFAELDKLVKKNNGLWSGEAEKYLLNNAKALEL